MPIAMQCPFFKREDRLKLNCGGGILKFPDARARNDYIKNYCAHHLNWSKCTIAQNLMRAYDRRAE